MTDKDKIARAAEIDAAIREHDQTTQKLAEDDAVAGEKLDKMLTGLHIKLDDCLKKMDAVSTRMDAVEASAANNTQKTKESDEVKSNRDRDTSEPSQVDRTGREHGMAHEVVADSQRRDESALIDAQARADAVAGEWGEKAPPPLSGERLQAYRCRLLRRYQRHSKQYKMADLDSIRDPAVFDGVEQSIFADAQEASRTPDAAPGQLRQKTRQVGGHTINDFYGDPSAWMNQFGGNRRFVTAINAKRPNDG